MLNIVQYVGLASLSAASVCLLLAMVFIERPGGRWGRGIGVGLAAFALALPIYYLGTTLGRASPWPPTGMYMLLGWKTAEDASRVYVMVTHKKFDTPRQFEVPFNLELALALQEVGETGLALERLCLWVDNSKGIEPEVKLYRFVVIWQQAMDFKCLEQGQYDESEYPGQVRHDPPAPAAGGEAAPAARIGLVEPAAGTAAGAASRMVGG